MKSAFLFRGALVGLCFALCSCASVSVREVIPLAESPTMAPQTIFVQTFEFEDDMLRVGREGEELEEFKRTMQQEMTTNILERVRKYVAPAQAVSSETEVPRGNSWLMSGRFTRVNQGSRFLRGALRIRQRRNEDGCHGDSVRSFRKCSEAISHDSNDRWVKCYAGGHRRSCLMAGDLYGSTWTDGRPLDRLPPHVARNHQCPCAIHEEARPPGRGRRSKAEAKGQPAVVATEQRRGVISKL